MLPNRYFVATDCREIDQFYQQTFILDAPSRDKFRIEGEEYLWCVGLSDMSAQQPAKPIITPANTLQKLSNTALVDNWADQNEPCRGGSEAATYRAGVFRTAAEDELKQRGPCYKTVRGRMD